MRTLLAATIACCLAGPAAGSFVIEIDADGLNDGAFALSPNFAFGGATTSASTSVASTAVGLAGADSFFGGDSPSGTNTPMPDTYVYSYAPGVDGDNTPIAAGTALNDDGDFATGLPAGATGLYAVYVTYPFTSSVSNTPTNYVLSDGSSDLLSVSFDQNGLGNEWIKLGVVALDSGQAYTLTQTSTPNLDPGGPGPADDVYSNGFVSMRAHGVLFERIPEPASALLTMIAAGGACSSSRRRRRVSLSASGDGASVGGC